MLKPDSRRRLKIFLVTVCVSSIVSVGFQISGNKDMGAWTKHTSIAQIVGDKIDDSNDRYLKMDLWNRSMETADPGFRTAPGDLIMLFVLDATSCPLVFNDVTDFTEIAKKNNIYAATVIISEDDDTFDFERFAAVNQWATPVFNKPEEVLAADIGIEFSGVMLFRHLLLIDRSTGRIINSGQLSTAVIPLQNKIKIVDDTIVDHLSDNNNILIK